MCLVKSEEAQESLSLLPMCIKLIVVTIVLYVVLNRNPSLHTKVVKHNLKLLDKFLRRKTNPHLLICDEPIQIQPRKKGHHTLPTRLQNRPRDGLLCSTPLAAEEAQQFTE